MHVWTAKSALEIILELIENLNTKDYNKSGILAPVVTQMMGRE